MNLSYLIDELRDNITDSFWVRHRIANHIVGRANLIHPGRDGVDLTERQWDNLIILDGCRYDIFDEVMDGHQDYRSVNSLGSKTPEWAIQNFGGGTFPDVVYLSSNPWVQRVLGNPFHKLIDVWEEVDGTVSPAEMYERALEAHETYPDKRLVVHFLQPHRPFLNSENGLDDNSPWRAVADGSLPYGIVWREYRENLELVIPYALELIDELDGWSILTSDHGNMMGERAPTIPIRIYGHPGWVRAAELVEVPYMEFTDGPRRRTTSGEVGPVAEHDRDVVAQRLQDLGYHE